MFEFIIEDNQIKPKKQGTDYELIPGKVYNLLQDKYSGDPYLEEDGSLNMPKKLYNTSEDTSFIDRVITSYHKTSKLTTGIMLGGTKGTGKTVMAKQIAIKSELPIIVVNEKFRSNRVHDFFKMFTTPVCIIFDEIDKNQHYWDTEELLGFLDGVQATAKKLVLMTCNNISKINEHFIDRCSRIKYYRKFEASENERFLKSIIEDKGIIDTNDELYNYIVSTFKLLSIDNVLSFIDEYLMFPDLTKDQICKDMNIVTKSAVTSEVIGDNDDDDDDDE